MLVDRVGGPDQRRLALLLPEDQIAKARFGDSPSSQIAGRFVSFEMRWPDIELI